MNQATFITDIQDHIARLIEQRPGEKWERFRLENTTGLVTGLVYDFKLVAYSNSDRYLRQEPFPQIRSGKAAVGLESRRVYTRESKINLGMEKLDIKWGVIKILSPGINIAEFINGPANTIEGYFEISNFDGSLFIATTDFRRTNGVYSRRGSDYWNNINQQLELEEAIPHILRNAPIEKYELNMFDVAKRFLRT